MDLTKLMTYDWINVETSDGVLTAQFLCFYNGYVFTTTGEQYEASKVMPVCISKHIWKSNNFVKLNESIYSPDTYVLIVNDVKVIKFVFKETFPNITEGDFNTVISNCTFDYAQKGISHSIEIKYVYEIQHILHMLGYDEIAKNFKI